jgi:16S rRNA processing protein RimM
VLQPKVSTVSDWLIVGKFGRPHGIKGLITVVSFTEPRENIVNYTHWHVHTHEHWQPLALIETKINNKFILAKIEGYHAPEQVAALTNIEIAIKREQLKTLQSNDYYWHDLIGMQVLNQKGIVLGDVTDMMATGSNDVLIVQGNRRHLIPYIPRDVIVNINTSQRIITVDWDADF